LPGHPYFFNQLFGGVDQMALSGAMLTEALNSSWWVVLAAAYISLITVIVYL